MVYSSCLCLLKVPLAKFGEKYHNLRKLFGENMKYIYQNPDWHNFIWYGEKIQKLLLDIKKHKVIYLEKWILSCISSTQFYLSSSQSSVYNCFIPLWDTLGTLSIVSKYFGLWSLMLFNDFNSLSKVIFSITVSATW